MEIANPEESPLPDEKLRQSGDPNPATLAEAQTLVTWIRYKLDDSLQQPFEATYLGMKFLYRFMVRSYFF